MSAVHNVGDSVAETCAEPLIGGSGADSPTLWTRAWRQTARAAGAVRWYVTSLMGDSAYATYVAHQRRHRPTPRPSPSGSSGATEWTTRTATPEPAAAERSVLEWRRRQAAPSAGSAGAGRAGVPFRTSEIRSWEPVWASHRGAGGGFSDVVDTGRR